MRDSAAAWLRQNERTFVPGWIKMVRSRGGDRDRQLTTKELERQFFVDFYGALALAVERDAQEPVAEVIERIAVTRVEQEFQLEETLDILFLLKELIWESLLQSYSAEGALSRMRLIEPTFNRCVQLMGRAFTRASHKLLSERLVEAEFMTRRLTMATEEADRALSRLRILYNISRAISSTLDQKQILAAVVENLASMPQIDRCAVWLADREARELSVAAVRGIDSKQLEGAYLLLDEDRSIVTRAFQTRQMQITSQVNAQDGLLISLFPQRSLLVVPLQGEDRPLGVISVDRLVQNRPFETAVIEMVQSIAEQAGMALHNIFLYQELVRLNQHLDQRVRERTEELERLNRELAKLDKKKSDFIVIAAHELKTPLTLIQGYAEMLAEGGIESMPPELLERQMAGIIRGTERLRMIIEDIIDVSLIDTQVLTLNSEMVSLSQILELTCRDRAQAAKERNIEIRTEDLGSLPAIEGDALRLHQVFSNIIGNAIKYTPDGGTVRIGARHLEADGDQPVFVEVVIADSGVGIDLEDQERIFDKFYRVESPELHSSSKTRFMGAGPGLGLTIAKGIVEAHGGRIWVESPGYDPVRCPGSQFHVLLPVRSAWGDFQGRNPLGEQSVERKEHSIPSIGVTEVR
ncbi:MAG: ATP-binding protein [Anaerolineae bacterium]